MILVTKKISIAMKMMMNRTSWRVKTKSFESEDASSSNKDNIAQDSVEISDDKPSVEGDGRNRVNGVHSK